MKKNIIINLLGLFVLVITLVACTKKYCYECKTYQYTVVYPEQDTINATSSSKIHCDQTQSTISQIEKDGTNYVSFYKDGKLHQVNTVTICDK